MIQMADDNLGEEGLHDAEHTSNNFPYSSGLNHRKSKNPANPHKHCEFRGIEKARDGTRTRGLDLGKVALHQLSHSRIIIFR